MLLQQIRLKNIRSYTEETVNLAPGSTLLSGDIGCGKSTILLAIEFALFGISRPDLLGEALLKKGATTGSVELSFNLNGEDIIIQRALKKDKDSVKQTSGYIIRKQAKKELTPLELKSEILNLLGYPQEVLTKNKNYLYRYTVYCPQEEMKFILQEDAEIRLDTLRKIFNLDRYKTVRENLQVYLKEMRINLASLESKISPLEEYKKRILELEAEKEQINSQMSLLKPKIDIILAKKEELKEEQEKLEAEQKKYQELKQQFQTLNAVLSEKEKQKVLLQQQKQKIQDQKNLFPEINFTKEELQQEIINKEKMKNQFLAERSILLEKIKQLQSRISEYQPQLEELSAQIQLIKEKKTNLLQLRGKIKPKEEIKKQKQENENKIEQLNNSIAQNNILLKQSEQIISRIGSLVQCPNCLQEVRPEHKHKIWEENKAEINRLKLFLREQNNIRAELLKSLKELAEGLDQIQLFENKTLQLDLEIKHLSEKQELSLKLKESLTLTVQENNQLMQKLNSLQKGANLDKLDQEIDKLRDNLNLILKKTDLEQQFNEILKREESLLFEIHTLDSQKNELIRKLSESSDNALQLSENKKEMQHLLSIEQELNITQARLQQDLRHLGRQEEQLQKTIDTLTAEKNRLLHLRELYHWLEEHFFKLTHTLEKQMMVNIYSLFNQLFQEWFSILIDDDNIYSRIDDSFTPIIEQNGYEISFVNLSGGEKTSCALAYRLALNRVINDIIHEIKTKDLLILDEPTDGFSSEQLDKVRDVLERLNLKQTIIVSHESKIESFVENVIRIRKEGNVSGVM